MTHDAIVLARKVNEDYNLGLNSVEFKETILIGGRIIPKVVFYTKVGQGSVIPNSVVLGRNERGKPDQEINFIFPSIYYGNNKIDIETIMEKTPPFYVVPIFPLVDPCTPTQPTILAYLLDISLRDHFPHLSIYTSFYPAGEVSITMISPPKKLQYELKVAKVRNETWDMLTPEEWKYFLFVMKFMEL